MKARDVDVWGEVRRLRLQIADEFAGLSPAQWDLPSWCAAWAVRDVLGHLVQNVESTSASMLCQIMRNPVHPDRAVDRLARKLGEEGVPDLIRRLRLGAERHYRIPGLPAELGLGDVLVHQADMLGPVGILTDPPIGDVLVVLDTYRTWGRRMFHAAPHRDLSLVATDADWRMGQGPEVTGRAIDLLLLVANRRQVIDRLNGPGIAQLIKRSSTNNGPPVPS